MSVPAWLARNVFRLQEAALHRPTFSVLEELERTQWLSREDMLDYQTGHLNVLLQTALAHSPWHAARLHAAGLAETVQAGAVLPGDLARLPTMDKRDARENVEQLVWRGVPGGVFPYTTGGSSGEPLIFHFGRARQAADAAGRLRARCWWGVAPGEREVYLWGAPVELSRTDRIKTLRDRLVNQLLLNAFAMSPACMDDYLTAMQAWNPKAIYGYASSLALLAAHAGARGARLRLPALRVVSTTGEPLFPHQRELIERAFGVPVSVEYGARDAGLMALQSPDGALLQMSETHLIEVLDAAGRPAEEGEAVITSLVSAAQPFIRYRTGDVVRQSGRSDPGGRGLTVLDAVVGRQTDFILAADGRIMHALAVIYVLRAVPGVGQFKLIQHAIDRLEVQVVPDARWNDEARATVIRGLRARLGTTLAVEVRLLDAIAPEASGKHRYVVSHVPVHGALAQAAR
ncbi:MAG: capsule biosynthesis protein CapK [Thiobacillus sp. 63-78]|uniref:phenylacetate--CoA ligase family protein n=1 Tax=Thiobacillus sp. 63-78 TaxID=1895859 RepID=UPI000960A47D|nr:phenylacetate--CoA ligase family protein [Thiobacillus sp. 63-78]MBN8772772.1 phenylacetate--CoA ligase family protein [Thiobacillus sp.]OJZ14872.1 MAG: capsule biosynthesis protein CapK [Thiobacillus sp. 63-78]